MEFPLVVFLIVARILLVESLLPASCLDIALPHLAICSVSPPDHPSLSKENYLCCPARHILTNPPYWERTSYTMQKYLRSLRTSRGITGAEEREVGFLS